MTTLQSGANDPRPVSLMTPRWALKRAAIGAAAVLAFVVVMTLLLDASIEPETAVQTAADQNPA